MPAVICALPSFSQNLDEWHLGNPAAAARRCDFRNGSTIASSTHQSNARSPIQKRKQAPPDDIDIANAAKISKMVLLVPDIVEAIVAGRADDRVMLKVLEGPLPVDWEQQREVLTI